MTPGWSRRDSNSRSHSHEFHHGTRVASFKARLSITRPLGNDPGEADDDLTCRTAILGRQCRELLIAQARVNLRCTNEELVAKLPDPTCVIIHLVFSKWWIIKNLISR
jgi:hypothetical protein